MIKSINRNIEKVLWIVGSTLFLVLGLTSPKTHAEPVPTDFWCASTGTEFKTRARYSDGSEKPVIVWSNYLEELSPEERCNRASRQFRINYANGLRHPVAGQSSLGKPAICAVKEPTSTLVKCSQSNILFNIGKEDNASRVQGSIEESILPGSNVITHQIGKGENSELAPDIELVPDMLRGNNSHRR